METIDLTRASVYVCPQRKNSGYLPQGVWIELICYKNVATFQKACRQLLPMTDVPPVYFDYEQIPSVYVSESWLCPELFPLVHFVSGLSGSDQAAFSIWIDLFRPDLGEIGLHELERLFRQSYEGCFPNPKYFSGHYAWERLGISADSLDFDHDSYMSALFPRMFLFRDGHVFKNIR